MNVHLGLALSGGGAKGFAHLGVMQLLLEKGFKIDVISGTSAGAFAGVFVADGYEPKEVLKFFENKAFSEFASFGLPQGGFFKSTGLTSFLKKHLRSRTFDELQTPLKVIATDIEHGYSKVFEKGELIPTIVASCSVPIVFKPVEINKKYYVDGGLFKNFPVSTIRDECNVIIGVNVSPITELEYRNSLKYVAERSFHYMSASNTIMDRTMCDYLIESRHLSGFSMFDLENIKEIYQIGYDEAAKSLSENMAKIKRDFPTIHLE